MVVRLGVHFGNSPLSNQVEPPLWLFHFVTDVSTTVTQVFASLSDRDKLFYHFVVGFFFTLFCC